MKKLYVLRHAKAGKSNKKILEDHERPLSDKGIESCGLIAEYLKENAENPKLVLCSTSQRTRSTFDEVFKDHKPEPDVKYDSRIYLASAADIFSIIGEIDDNIDSLMIIGHNPGVQELSLSMAGKAEDKLIKKLDYFPPGSLAIFDIEGSWKNIEHGNAKLTAFTIPKNIDGEFSA